jgi:proteasome alpha subunit
VVAEVGDTAADDQIYRITFDGTVTDEHNYLVMGGQVDQVATVVKDRYRDALSLAGAMEVAIAALAGQANGDQQAAAMTGAQLEVALLDRSRAHRKFRRLSGTRLDDLLAQAGATNGTGPAAPASGTDAASPDASNPDDSTGGAAGTPG